ncbi:hypothetical protein BS47DRAFT_1370487 [Hydnum rufescens UP504]|uniref:Ribosomal RNA-processing protein 8 n=1 Tax=Hydnum rufescens UP504 TaxID=1448309 RepID=A0A9P6E0B4_9AGAM|nr:hypothetical protein BS47DRAFT_1370487 [Hydnum rufescens UP504]
MGLFEAPGWDTGTTPIVNNATGPSLKRSKRKRAESNDDASDTTTSTTQSLPPSKKPRLQREESDILPPSSAGDGEEDPGSVLSHIKTKKRSKKQRKLAATSLAAAKKSVDTAGAIVDVSDAGMETETDGNRNTGRPTHGWRAIEDDSSSGEFAGLTKLQREMKQKLSGGKFRMINELLYKSDSAGAHEMMRKNPTMYNEYHAGFRNQVVSWPTNPVSYYTSIISSYPQTTVVADLGCGDAALAKNLVPQGVRVLSFDLVSDGEWVVEADICDRIPLPGKDDGKQAQVVDIVVCALSLMNLNWIRCIREARRILKIGGELKIAEVSSRFNDVKAFQAVICSIGFDFLSKEEPSTHFVLFEFRKASRSRPFSKKEWGDLLSPCEYKRR